VSDGGLTADNGTRRAAARPSRHHVAGVIDLHCHLLPGIDDGPGDEQAALALARALVAEGVTTVAATSHVHPDFPNTAATLGAARSAVSDAIAREGIPLEVVRGAELDLLHVAQFDAAALGELQLGEGGTLLVECPFAAAAPFFAETVARFGRDGFRVLLAHPERSPAFLREPALLERLVAGGAMASLTAASLTGRFGRTAKRYADWALEEGLIHDVASDAHNVDGRPPVLRAPLEEAGYGWALDWLTVDAPAAILGGAALPVRPDRPRRRFPSLRRGGR
jgi:protein-tyrosine phosphatase